MIVLTTTQEGTTQRNNTMAYYYNDENPSDICHYDDKENEFDERSNDEIEDNNNGDETISIEYRIDIFDAGRSPLHRIDAIDPACRRRVYTDARKSRHLWQALMEWIEFKKTRDRMKSVLAAYDGMQERAKQQMEGAEKLCQDAQTRIERDGLSETPEAIDFSEIQELIYERKNYYLEQIDASAQVFNEFKEEIQRYRHVVEKYFTELYHSRDWTKIERHVPTEDEIKAFDEFFDQMVELECEREWCGDHLTIIEENGERMSQRIEHLVDCAKNLSKRQCTCKDVEPDEGVPVIVTPEKPPGEHIRRQSTFYHYR